MQNPIKELINKIFTAFTICPFLTTNTIKNTIILLKKIIIPLLPLEKVTNKNNIATA